MQARRAPSTERTIFVRSICNHDTYRSATGAPKALGRPRSGAASLVIDNCSARYSSVDTPILISIFSFVVSLISALIASVALYFTFKKDAHRLRLHRRDVNKGWHDVLSINNDSSFSVQIAAVGCLTTSGKIHWLASVGEYRANQYVNYPIPVPGRSTYHVIVMHRYLPSTYRHGPRGYCVQLDCGRTFVITSTLGRRMAVAFGLKSLASRLWPGKVGFPRGELHLRPE